MGPKRDPDAAQSVRATYDRIADHFAKTRANPWPEVDSFLLSAESGAVGLDIGCANGRHLRPLARRVERTIGLDVSRALLDIAAAEVLDGQSNVHLVQADATVLPLAADVVDVGVYVATIHHLRPRASRVGSLDELARVLSSNGRALVSAWSTEHGRFDAETGYDTTVDWTLHSGETVPRYYHIYDPAEFRADLDRSDLTVVDTFVSNGNCYAEVEE